MISPYIKFIDKRYLVAVSFYSELNIYILDILKKTGLIFDLRVTFLKDIEISSKMYFYDRKFYLPDYNQKLEEIKLTLYEIKFSN